MLKIVVDREGSAPSGRAAQLHPRPSVGRALAANLERVVPRPLSAELVSDLDAEAAQMLVAILSRGPLVVPASRLLESRTLLSPGAAKWLEARIDALRLFYAKTMPSEVSFRDAGGRRVGVRYRPLERIGIVLPRTRRAWSLLLSLAVPAIVAGVEEVLVAVSGPNSSRAILAACDMLPVGDRSRVRVLRLGGPMAVHALAFGTDLTAPVDLVLGEDGDETRAYMRNIAGFCRVEPTRMDGELVIITDGLVVDAERVASEVVNHVHNGRSSGAEADAPVTGDAFALLCPDRAFLTSFVNAVDDAVAGAPEAVRAWLSEALPSSGRLVHVKSLRRAIRLVNDRPPARLWLCVRTPKKLVAGLEPVGVTLVGPEAMPSRMSVDEPGVHLAGMSRSHVPTAEQFLRPVATVRSDGKGTNRDKGEHFRDELELGELI